MPDYPLFFRFANIVRNDRFAAGILSRGRALMVEEDELWFMHGVEPGGTTAVGPTPFEAFLDFKRGYQEILEDLAEDTPDLDSFRTKVERFFLQVDKTDERRWIEASEAIREGREQPQGFFSTLPHVQSDKVARVRVVDPKVSFPDESRPEDPLPLLAAA